MVLRETGLGVVPRGLGNYSGQYESWKDNRTSSISSIVSGFEGKNLATFCNGFGFPTTSINYS